MTDPRTPAEALRKMADVFDGTADAARIECSRHDDWSAVYAALASTRTAYANVARDLREEASRLEAAEAKVAELTEREAAEALTPLFREGYGSLPEGVDVARDIYAAGLTITRKDKP